MNFPRSMWIVAAGVFILQLQIRGFFVHLENKSNFNSNKETTPFNINLSIINWLFCGASIGTVIGTFFSQHYGSRNSIILCFIINLLSWLVMIFSRSLYYLCISRLISGLGIGIALVTYPLYSAEITSAKNRGVFYVIVSISVPISLLITTTFELAKLHGKIFEGIFLTQCLIGIGIFFIVPDSPYNLAKKNDLTLAEKSLQWYRGEKNIEDELYDIKQYLRENHKNIKKN